MRGCGGGQGFAFGDAQLEGDEVEAEDGFGDGVFDLEAGVHLQEVRASVGGEQEFDGARSLVADGVRGGHGGVVQPGAQRVVESGGGCFLDDLLVASLERAVAGAERPDPAVSVGHDLDLDVPAALHVGLGEDLAVPERGRRLRGRCRQLPGQFGEFAYDPHSASTAARPPP